MVYLSALWKTSLKSIIFIINIIISVTVVAEIELLYNILIVF